MTNLTTGGAGLPATAAGHAVGFTKEQFETLRSAILADANDKELQLFEYVCRKTGLDPFTRQIYGRIEVDKKTGHRRLVTITSIDGFRLIAHRTGDYEGQLGPFWCGKDGAWREAWVANEPPLAARVGVFRRGFREPLFAVARFASYAQTYADGNLKGQWRTMPEVMIAKCAEALALRKAFPNELGSIYGEEEMQQAEPKETRGDYSQSRPVTPASQAVLSPPPSAETPTADKPPKALPVEAKALPEEIEAIEVLGFESLAEAKQMRSATFAAAKRNGWSDERLRAAIHAEFEKPGLKPLTKKELLFVRDAVRRPPPDVPPVQSTEAPAAPPPES